jgi:uncharacterized integral membrane protein (TIGR00698 family)
MKQRVELKRSLTELLSSLRCFNLFDWFRNYGTGLTLLAGIASFAFGIHSLAAFRAVSPLMLAILLGVLIHNTVGISKRCQPGIQFSLKRLLRVSIALLGLQLSLAQLMAIGAVGLSIVLLTLGCTFALTLWIGRRLKVSPALVNLIAAGTSICGASAIIAANVVVEDSDENVAYAVAMVTIFGTCSMLLYPPFSTLLHLTPHAFGIWCGVSIHEVAQVVAAAFQNGAVSGQIAIIAKLSRVVLLAPMMVLLNRWVCRSNGDAVSRQSQSIPWFVLWFIGFIGINSLGVLPESLQVGIIRINQIMLVMALAAMGLETNLKKVWQIGVKPLYLAFLSWLFITFFSLILILVFYI